jgi:hypothetical protein
MYRLSISWRVRRLARVSLILAAAACGPMRRGAGEPPAVIIFANQSLEQATVYVVAPSREFRRIGTVFAGRTDTLSVPADLTRVGSLNIVARLLARPELPQTGPISMYPGERYRITLPLDVKLLSFLPAGS